MGKKRKSDANRLDEIDRNMYTTFCSAANFLSQLYTQAMNQQKFSFQAGERHGMEKLYQWILRQQEEGSRVPTCDIVAYLQNELDYTGEDISMSPRLQCQHQYSQTAPHLINSSIQGSSGSHGQTIGSGPRSCHSDQTKNSVFSNALSSPVRRSLQSYQMEQGGYYPGSIFSGTNNTRNHEPNLPQQSRESNDTSMDIHADDPDHQSY